MPVPDGSGPAAGGPDPGASTPAASTSGPARQLTVAVAALLGVAAVAAGLSVAGVRGQPVAGLALLFLLTGPGAALAWALPGQPLRLRLLVALVGPLVVDTLIAQVMLSLRWWSPRGGTLAALAVTAALLACGAFATRRPAPVEADSAEADPSEGAGPGHGAEPGSPTGPTAGATALDGGRSVPGGTARPGSAATGASRVGLRGADLLRGLGPDARRSAAAGPDAADGGVGSGPGAAAGSTAPGSPAPDPRRVGLRGAAVLRAAGPRAGAPVTGPPPPNPAGP